MNTFSAVAPRRRDVAGVADTLAHEAVPGYWPKTVSIAIAMFAIIAVRFHELVPVLALFRPALLLSVGGTLLILHNTARPCIRDALRHPISVLVVLYFAWGVATVPTALWPAHGVDTLKALLPAILLFIAVQLAPPRPVVVNRILYGFIAALTIFAFLGRASARVRGGRMRFELGMYDSNDLAALMALAFPLALGAALRLRGRAQVAAWIGMFIVLLTTIATGSRGGFLGLVAGGLAFVAASRGPKQLIVAIVLAVGGVIGWSSAAPTFRSRILGLTDLSNDYNVTSEVGRQAVWKRGWTYIKANPIMGVGIGNFSMAEGDYFTTDDRRGKWSTAHNSYIQVAAETGFPGAFIFVAMVGTALGIGWRLSRGAVTAGGITRMPEYFASPVAFAVTALFLSHAYFNPLFGMLGLIALADRAYFRAPPIASPATARAVPRWERRSGFRGGLAVERERLRDAWPR